MAEVYLRAFRIPDDEEERYHLYGDLENRIGHSEIWTSVYPFGVLAKWRERTPPLFRFAPVTIFCGSNGCGKSTLLNVIAYALGLPRHAAINSTEFFREYVDLCEHDCAQLPRESKIITSDDIFDRMQKTRVRNESIDAGRQDVRMRRIEMIHDIKEDAAELRLRGLQDYEMWRAHYDAVYEKYYQYLQKKTVPNELSESNGETAIRYLTNEISEDALYLLDEPENSLSPSRQLILKQHIEDAARFFRCQFILATHSPILLSIRGAVIYDFDDAAYAVRAWTALPEVRVWYDFFRAHDDAFSCD